MKNIKTFQRKRKEINQHLFYICSTIFNDYTYNLSYNINAIELLKANPEKIDW